MLPATYSSRQQPRIELTKARMLLFAVVPPCCGLFALLLLIHRRSPSRGVGAQTDADHPLSPLQMAPMTRLYGWLARKITLTPETNGCTVATEIRVLLCMPVAARTS